MMLYSSCLVAAVTAKSSGKSQWPVVKKSDMIGLIAPAARYDYGYDYGYDSSEDDRCYVRLQEDTYCNDEPMAVAQIDEGPNYIEECKEACNAEDGCTHFNVDMYSSEDFCRMYGGSCSSTISSSNTHMYAVADCEDIASVDKSCMAVEDAVWWEDGTGDTCNFYGRVCSENGGSLDEGWNPSWGEIMDFEIDGKNGYMCPGCCETTVDCGPAYVVGKDDSGCFAEVDGACVLANPMCLQIQCAGTQMLGRVHSDVINMAGIRDDMDLVLNGAAECGEFTYDEDLDHILRNDTIDDLMRSIVTFSVNYGDCDMKAEALDGQIKFETVLSNPPIATSKGIFLADSFSNAITFTCLFDDKATTDDSEYTVTTNRENFSIDQKVQWDDFTVSFFDSADFETSVESNNLQIGDSVFVDIQWNTAVDQTLPVMFYVDQCTVASEDKSYNVIESTCGDADVSSTMHSEEKFQQTRVRWSWTSFSFVEEVKDSTQTVTCMLKFCLAKDVQDGNCAKGDECVSDESDASDEEDSNEHSCPTDGWHMARFETMPYRVSDNSYIEDRGGVYSMSSCMEDCFADDDCASVVYEIQRAVCTLFSHNEETIYNMGDPNTEQFAIKCDVDPMPGLINIDRADDPYETG